MSNGERDADRNVRLVVQALRATRQLGVGDLAAHLGVSRNGMSERLHGKRRITVAELDRLAQLFNVEPGQFFVDVDDLFGNAKGAYLISAGQAA